jgi:hypothetical protein
LGRRSRKRGRTDAPPARPASLARGYARGEVRNEAIREGLEPLAPGERPRAVTVAAVVSTLGVVVLLVGYATGLIEHRKGGGAGIASSVVILGLAAWGLWRGRYWAVLGFQALLALNIVVMCVLLVRASSLLGVAIALVVILGGGTLFWKLVRAMARLQMPERYPAERVR